MSLPDEGASARLLEAVVRVTAGVFDAAAASLALLRWDGALVYRASWGAGAEEICGIELGPGEGIAGAVVASQTGEVVPDCRADPRFAKTFSRRTGYVPHTMIVVPLLRGTRVIGVLAVLDRRDGEPYGVADLARAVLFADLAVAALDADPRALADLESTEPGTRERRRPGP